MVKEKLLLIGAGGLGRVTSEIARLTYDCAFVDDGVPVGTAVCDIPVIGTTADLDSLFGEYQKLVVSIGNNPLREQLYRRAAEIGYTFPNVIDASVYVSPYATMGSGCIILQRAVIQNGATVGDGVILNPGVEIHHDSIIGNWVLIYTNSVVRTLARVGDRAHIGSTLTISNRVVVEPDEFVPDGQTRRP